MSNFFRYIFIIQIFLRWASLLAVKEEKKILSLIVWTYAAFLYKVYMMTLCRLVWWQMMKRRAQTNFNKIQ